MESARHQVPLTIRVLVLSDRTDEGELLLSLLAPADDLHVRLAPVAFGEAVKAINRYDPHILLVANTIDTTASVIEELDNVAPGIPSVAILEEGDVKGAQDCALAGARATVLKPFDREGVLQAIRQVHMRETRRKQYVASTLEAGAARQQRPRVIAIHGAKGGVGTSTLASNMAVALRHLTGRRVALIDGDVLSGDARVIFDLDSPRSIADLLPQLQELDADVVEGLLIGHESGVRVLLAPDAYQRAEALGGDDMLRTLSALKPYFDYQIVDTQSHVTPVTLAVLDEADLIVLIVTPEIVALRNAARFLQLASQLGYPSEKILLVANRAGSGRDITPTVIEQYLRRPVAVAIPSDGTTLIECMNAGALVVTRHPRNKVASAITRLAQEIAVSFGWDARQDHARTGAGTAKPASAPSTPDGANGKAAGGLRRSLPSFLRATSAPVGIPATANAAIPLNGDSRGMK